MKEPKNDQERKFRQAEALIAAGKHEECITLCDEILGEIVAIRRVGYLLVTIPLGLAGLLAAGVGVVFGVLIGLIVGYIWSTELNDVHQGTLLLKAAASVGALNDVLDEEPVLRKAWDEAVSASKGTTKEELHPPLWLK